MKKLITMIALAAISFGSVYANVAVKSTMQNDTTKKSKKDTTKKKSPTIMKRK
jgi:uncharacterized alpha/beta hydrolase family protein